VTSGCQSCSGRLFHSVGPAVAKQRSANWLRDQACLIVSSLQVAARSNSIVPGQRLIADSGRQLRSAHANVLTVPRTNSRFGDRIFSVAGPRIWNSLPASLRQPDTEVRHFKGLLKAFLFGETSAAH